jgi:hypothetical protein
LVWKRILPATTVFQGGNSLSMLQIGLFTWVEEPYVSLQRKPAMKVATALSTLLSRETQKVFERSTSYKPKFSRWKRVILLQIHQFILLEEAHVSLEGNPSA